MPKFLTVGTEKTNVEINRNQVYWMVNFEFPDNVREILSFEDIQKLTGTILMGFYSDPMKGDSIERFGHTWEVERRKYIPTKYRSHETKYIGVVVLLYVGEGV